ncbi:MAG: hypothetical protein ACI9VS_003832 [Candidatus Binatia bacterium]|jgi:hypothetical protein
MRFSNLYDLKGSMMKPDNRHSTKSADNAVSPETFSRVVMGAFVFQIVFLAIAAFQNQDALNTDGIAYLRIATYYADGQTDLMVSGYWGPLMSWLMVPFIKAGLSAMIAARIVMAISGIVFLLGCRAVFRAFDIDRTTQLIGIWIAAATSIFWSVRNITPDLLLAGLMGLAIASLANRTWLDSKRGPVVAGVFWGLAYLAKAVAFPLAILISGAFAILLRFTGAADTKQAARQLAITVAVFACVSAPWMLTLSMKYGGPTFSTSGRINHAIAGPPDVERYHPFARTYYSPAPGRVTQWEDPSNMDYQFWSPFESGPYAAHQTKLIFQNLPKVAGYFCGFNVAHLLRSGGELSARDLLVLIPGFDLFYIGLAGLIGCVFMRRNWRKRLAEERWRWALVPVLLMAGIYLPVYLRSDDLRYFYPAFPLVWVACSGLLFHLVSAFAKQAERIRGLGIRLLAGSFALPALIWLLAACVGIPNAASWSSRILADRIEAANVNGPIAGSATIQGGRAGLYTAYYLNQPWHGDEPNMSPENLKKSGARIAIVFRFDPSFSQLQFNPAFRNLDALLFRSSEEAAEFPLAAFEIVASKIR